MKKIFILFFILFANLFSKAQYNVIKFNVPGVALGNYAVQIERAIHEKRSLLLAFSYMPGAQMPSVLANNDPTLEKMKVSGYSLMPEIRFYPGLGDKDAPRGFYMGLYGKYSKYDFNTDFVPKNVLIPNTYHVTGDFTGYGGGLVFGVQWVAWKHLSIDWMILGIHGGGSKTNASIDQLIPVTDQASIKNQLDGIVLPLELGSIRSEVSNTGATMNVDMPFLGFRSGLSLGFAF